MYGVERSIRPASSVQIPTILYTPSFKLKHAATRSPNTTPVHPASSIPPPSLSSLPTPSLQEFNAPQIFHGHPLPDRPAPTPPQMAHPHFRASVSSLTTPRKYNVFTGVSPEPTAKYPTPTASKAATSTPSTCPMPLKTTTQPGGGLTATTPTEKSSPNHTAAKSPACRALRSSQGSNVSSIGPLPPVP
ncbi:hypothetical protein JB92DRAFT_3106167 [Gautieria morchelliformis]|nr:hypothetical protein JB92DRAFT_3106167 [Gautieria morchelliformis]